VSWRSLGVEPRVVEALEAMGAPAPTAVQAAAIPGLLAGRDTLVHAPTGSGKTLTYLVPLMSQIDASRQSTQALILVPTRELGLQVSAVARRLGALVSRHQKRRLTVMSLLSGSKLRRQRAWAWASPPHVVVGQAREVETMLALGGLKKDLTAFKFAVVDEVDIFFENDDYNDQRDAIGRILGSGGGTLGTRTWPSRSHKNSPQRTTTREDNGAFPRRQTAFATATIEQPRYFVASKLGDWCSSCATPDYVAVEAGTLPANLRHFATSCDDPSKRLTVARKVLRTLKPKTDFGPVLVFFDEKRAASLRDFASALETADGHAVAVLDKKDDLQTRSLAVDAVRRDTVDVLLATDLAARGLDLPNVRVVLNFDTPRNAVSYAHRAGRTGRFGKPGAVVSVVHDKEKFAFTRISASYFNIDVDDFQFSTTKKGADSIAAFLPRRTGGEEDEIHSLLVEPPPPSSS